MSAATLDGIEKMKKAELIELCEKHGIDPPKTVAEMKYKLKRLYEEDDDDDDDEDVAPPPKKKAKAAKGSSAVGKLVEVKGDVVNPKGPDAKRLLVHAVAAGAGLRWSKRGTMGQITTAFGQEPRIQYEAAAHTLKAGNVQYVDVSGNNTIASVVCLGKPAPGSAPPFDHAAFTVGLRNVASTALSSGALVHVARPDPRTPGLKMDGVMSTINDELLAKGVDVYIYQRAGGAGAGAAAAPAPAAPAKKAPSPAKDEDSTVGSPTGKGSRKEFIAALVEGKTLDDFPLDKAKPPKLIPVEKDSEEFWELEEKFNAHMQGRNEDYVENRIKKGLRPLKFILVGADKVENDLLECRFEIKKREIAKMRGQKEARERVSFHATHPKNNQSILKTSLLRFQHPLNPCKKQVDDGYFGSNKKGVYVSRYADYTLKYANNVVPLDVKDTVKTIMFRTVPGLSKHIPKLCGAIDPTPGFDSHSSPTYLEWYIFDEAQLCPEYLLHVRAEEDTRTKSDDE